MVSSLVIEKSTGLLYPERNFPKDNINFKYRYKFNLKLNTFYFSKILNEHYLTHKRTKTSL